VHTVSLFDAKTHLSRIIQELLSGSEDGVVVSRHGKPVAKIIPFSDAGVSRRLGVAKGRFKVPDDIDVSNPAIEALFSGEPDKT